MRLVLATANPHKATEIAEVLGAEFELVPRPADVPEVVEDADTFEGNARLKSSALVRATGEPALADDSGLEVDALDGAPGVHSARYAGDRATGADNVARLLDALSGVPRLAPDGTVPLRARRVMARRTRGRRRGHGRGPHRRSTTRRVRLRIRPGLRARRPVGRRPHVRRDVVRRETRHQPPRPRLARSGGPPPRSLKLLGCQGRQGSAKNGVGSMRATSLSLGVRILREWDNEAGRHDRRARAAAPRAGESPAADRVRLQRCCDQAAGGERPPRPGAGRRVSDLRDDRRLVADAARRMPGRRS